MTTVKIKCFVHKSEYMPSGVSVDSYDLSEFGKILIGTFDFDYEIPSDFNPTLAEIKATQSRIDAIKAAADKEIKPLAEKLKNLQCIDNAPMFLQEQTA